MVTNTGGPTALLLSSVHDLSFGIGEKNRASCAYAASSADICCNLYLKWYRYTLLSSLAAAPRRKRASAHASPGCLH
jgi:hypothetical protein